jgi:hypothetical protein
MTSWTDDDELMEELGRAVEQGREVPDHRRRAAYDAFTWRTIDEELMSLTHDSALASTQAVRGTEDARTLAFEGGGLTLELEVVDGTLTGQILQAAHGCEVTMERADGETRTVRADASGFFVLPEVAGPVRFAVDRDGDTHRTEWTVL